jgi:hypothetical protein
VVLNLNFTKDKTCLASIALKKGYEFRKFISLVVLKLNFTKDKTCLASIALKKGYEFRKFISLVC